MTTFHELAAQLDIHPRELHKKLSPTLEAYDFNDIEDPNGSGPELPAWDWHIRDSWVPYLTALALDKPVTMVKMELFDEDREELATVEAEFSRAILCEWLPEDIAAIDAVLMPALAAHPTAITASQDIYDIIEGTLAWRDSFDITEAVRTNGYAMARQGASS